MWSERPETKAAVLVLLLCGLLGSTGCASFYARQTFNEATLGQPWSQVSGSEQYSLGRGLLAVRSIEGPGEQAGTDYLIVLSDSGKVIAKAYKIMGRPTAYGLQIEAKCWQELKEVHSHYPYTVVVERVGDVEMLEYVYPPLVDPFSADDRVLASGVRQSTWATLMRFMSGWPFQDKDGRRFVESKVYWNGSLKGWPEVAKSMDQLPTEGTITVFWGKGPLSR